MDRVCHQYSLTKISREATVLQLACIIIWGGNDVVYGWLMFILNIKDFKKKTIDQKKSSNLANYHILYKTRQYRLIKKMCKKMWYSNDIFISWKLGPLVMLDYWLTQAQTWRSQTGKVRRRCTLLYSIAITTPWSYC